MKSEIAKKLFDRGMDVLGPLRDREGLDEEKFQQLCQAFREAKEALADADPVFKFIAWTLLDMLQIFEANICIYDEEQQERLNYAHEELNELAFEALEAPMPE